MSTAPLSPRPAPFPPGGPTPPTPQRSRRGLIVTAVIAVAALLLGVGIGRSSGSTAAATAIPAPTTVSVTSTKPAVTVTKTAAPVTVTAAPVTETAPPVTVTAPPQTVMQTGTAQVVVTEAAPAGPPAGIKDGISLVGTDIQPGTYKSDAEDCYFARLSGTSGELDDIITNGIGATIVTIDPTDLAFESRRCAPWVQVG